MIMKTMIMKVMIMKTMIMMILMITRMLMLMLMRTAARRLQWSSYQRLLITLLLTMTKTGNYYFPCLPPATPTQMPTALNGRKVTLKPMQIVTLQVNFEVL